MKKIALLCTLLAALCACIVFAGEITDIGNVPSKDEAAKSSAPAVTAPTKPDGTPMRTEVILGHGVPMTQVESVVAEEPYAAIKEEMDALRAEISAAVEAGLDADPALKERLSDLWDMMKPAAPPRRGLDQGGGSCASAFAIDPGSLPFCDTGDLDGTNDCAHATLGRPYNDIFYSFTPAVTDTYRLSTCGSPGDTYMRVWTDCCVTSLLTSDTECGGEDAAIDRLLTAGVTYWIEVGSYYDSVLTRPYNFNLYGPINSVVPTNNLCTGAITVSTGATSGYTRGGTTDTGLPTCDGTTSFYKGVWYYFFGNGNFTTVSTDNNCTNFNTRIFVWQGDCVTMTCMGGHNDISPTPGNSLSSFTFCAERETGYYILITNTSSTASYGGEFVMNITEGEECAGPVGRCCYGDPYAPQCQNVDEVTCQGLSGTWTFGMTCLANPCPQPPPVNDLCVNAIALTPPASPQGNCLWATNDTLPSCGAGATMGKQVWYTVVGDGNTLTASTCNAYTNFDTEIQVWCGRCGSLVCVGGNDDAGTTLCPISSVRSIYSWCSEPGTVYYIAVGHYSLTGTGGLFQLDVTSDGVPCTTYPECCIVDFTVTVPIDGGTYTGNTCNAFDDCDLPQGYTGSPEVVYKVTIPFAGRWTFSLCGSDYDTELGIGTTCCNDDVCYNDDYCDVQSECTCADIAAGTYYVTVSGYTYDPCGNYILTITPCGDPTARCCYGNDPDNPLCAEVTEAECTTLGGVWTFGQVCLPDPPFGCPVPFHGDDCTDPLHVTMPLPFAASGNNVGATNVYDFATAYCITNISYDNGYDLIYEMVIDRNMCITIGVVQGSYDYMSVSLWDACPDQGVVHCLAGTFASTGNLTIPCTPVVPGTYYIMLDNWPTPYQFDYTLTVDECTCPSSCEDWVLCGTPTETEPNGVCATEVDPYVIGCDALVYGKICPAADHDFYKIIVPPQTFMQLSFFDEVDCIASPPVCVRNNLYYEDCSVAGSANQYGWNMTNSGDVPWVLYIDFYALAGCQATYKIVTTCCPIVDYCLNPIYTPGEFFYQETVNTCCGTNVIPMIGTNCAATYASGKDVVFAIVIRDATCYIDSIHVEYPGADEQWWFGTDCTNPASCLFSQDAEGGAGAEVQYGMNVVAGTYYLVVSRYSTACGPLTVTIAADCRLPVEFLGADAIAGDGKVTVNWATASETNLDHFEISRDGEMVSIGANNTPERREYSWTETGLENGMTYTYSLVAVSLNGSRDELATVSATPSFEAGAVTEYALHQNYPNPFNPTTSISFDLKDAGLVNLKVYNLMGQEVAKVVNGEMSAGRHTVSFNSGNLSSGIYLYRIEVNGFAAEKKMLLMK